MAGDSSRGDAPGDDERSTDPPEPSGAEAIQWSRPSTKAGSPTRTATAATSSADRGVGRSSAAGATVDTVAHYGGHNVTVERSRYARLEDERRFLVAALPDGAASPRLIEDRYVERTRLRLRRVTDDRGTVLKLGHKVREDDAHPSAAWHTTLYLTDAEHALLERLDARTLTKRRWTLPGGGCADEFLGPLAGLVLVEGERPFHAPPRAVEVTDDERFTGGALAALDAEAAAVLVADARARAS